MTSGDLRKAIQRLRSIAKRRDQLSEDEAAAIEDALRLGAQQLDVAEAVQRSREHIRRIAAARGVPSRYPPRKKPRTTD